MAQAQEQEERPTTLDAALNVIDNLRVALDAAQKEADELSDEVDDLQREVSELEDQLDGDSEETSWLPEQTVTDLVKIRNAIKGGTVNDDHVYQLEKLLSELDSGWMCRA